MPRERSGKMQITCENKIEKSAADKKLWPKQYNMLNYGHFLCILALLRPKMVPPREALPMGPQSSSIYFWNQWNKENLTDNF